MKRNFAISLCAVCLGVAGLVAQQHASSTGSKGSFAQFVNDSIKAQTANDAKWLEAGLVAGYVEGTSFGSWIPKEQLIKDANDPANDKFTKNDVSDVETQVVGKCRPGRGQRKLRRNH